MLGAARGDSLQRHVHLQGVGTLDSEGLWLTMGLGLAVGITDLMAPSRLKVEPLSAIRGCPGVGDEPRAHLHISTSPLPYSGYGCGIEDTPLAAWCQSHFLYVLGSHPAVARHSSAFFPFPCCRAPKWRRDSGSSSVWSSPSS